MTSPNVTIYFIILKSVPRFQDNWNSNARKWLPCRCAYMHTIHWCLSGSGLPPFDSWWLAKHSLGANTQAEPKIHMRTIIFWLFHKFLSCQTKVTEIVPLIKSKAVISFCCISTGITTDSLCNGASMIEYANCNSMISYHYLTHLFELIVSLTEPSLCSQFWHPVEVLSLWLLLTCGYCLSLKHCGPVCGCCDFTLD